MFHLTRYPSNFVIKWKIRFSSYKVPQTLRASRGYSHRARYSQTLWANIGHTSHLVCRCLNPTGERQTTRNLIHDIKLNVEPMRGCQRPRDPTALAATISARKRLSPKVNFPDVLHRTRCAELCARHNLSSQAQAKLAAY